MRRVDVTLSYSDTEAAVILSHNLDSSKVARCPWVVEVQDNAPPFSGRCGRRLPRQLPASTQRGGGAVLPDEIMPKLRRALPGVKFHIYGSNTGSRDREAGG